MSVPHVFDTAMNLPDVLLTLAGALDLHDGDPGRARLDPTAAEEWDRAEPEVRSCILLSVAWMAGRGPAPTVGDNLHPAVADYVEDFHKYAASFSDDQAETFHGRAFPAMPLPGQAGALASSLGFDRDDLVISLGAALVLLAAGRKATE